MTGNEVRDLLSSIPSIDLSEVPELQQGLARAFASLTELADLLDPDPEDDDEVAP